MLKKSNQGFALIPVIAILSILSVAGYLSYYFFFKSNSDSNDLSFDSSIDGSENVLQATAGPRVDINNFLYSKIFGVPNLTEFNKQDTSIIVGGGSVMAESDCIFLPRASKPIKFAFSYNGKQVLSNVYLGSIYQNIYSSTKAVERRYLVVAAPQLIDFSKAFKPSLVSRCVSSSVMTLVFDQPTISLSTPQELSAYLLTPTKTFLTNPSTIPNTNLKINVSIKINKSGSDLNTFAQVAFETKNGDGNYVYNLFKTKGIIAKYSNRTIPSQFTPINIKELKCSGDCSKSFTVSIPYMRTYDYLLNFLDLPLDARLKFELLNKNCSIDSKNSINMICDL